MPQKRIFTGQINQLVTVTCECFFFQTVNFINEFYRPPTMITTAEHHKDNVKANIDADNNAMQEWVRVRNQSGHCQSGLL